MTFAPPPRLRAALLLLAVGTSVVGVPTDGGAQAAPPRPRQTAADGTRRPSPDPACTAGHAQGRAAQDAPHQPSAPMPRDTTRAPAAGGEREADADAAADRAYVREVECGDTPYKVLHAEPLFVDLIRDLGARKGEAEWNLGFGLTDRQSFDAYKVLVEYEWAPRDRLGVELELPATLYSGARVRTRPGASVPGTLNGADELTSAVPPASRLDGLKTAVQWTAHVSERRQTSVALGYINELRIADPRRGARRAVRGNLYNPFVVGAKRWTHNAHTLVYTGVRHEHAFGHGFAPPLVELNASAHYMLPGTRNFVGLEVNADRERRATHTVLRPQMRLGITDRMLLGVAVGVPVASDRERLGTFVRLIYEPSHRLGPRLTTAGAAHAPHTAAPQTPETPQTPRAPDVGAPGIVVVDSRRVLAEMPGAAAAGDTLGRDLGALGARVAALQRTLDERLAALERAAAAQPARRPAHRRAADSLRADVERRLATLEAAGEARRVAIVEPFTTAMRAAVEAERTAIGAGVVLDLGTVAPFVLAVDPVLDLTERVLARLARTPVSWPAAPAPWRADTLGDTSGASPAATARSVRPPPASAARKLPARARASRRTSSHPSSRASASHAAAP